jgi:hypothetical protein
LEGEWECSLEECKFVNSNGKCEEKLEGERSDVKGSLEYRQRENKLWSWGVRGFSDETCFSGKEVLKRDGLKTEEEKRHEFQ